VTLHIYMSNEIERVMSANLFSSSGVHSSKKVVLMRASLASMRPEAIKVLSCVIWSHHMNPLSIRSDSLKYIKISIRNLANAYCSIRLLVSKCFCLERLELQMRIFYHIYH